MSALFLEICMCVFRVPCVEFGDHELCVSAVFLVLNVVTMSYACLLCSLC